MHYRFRIVFIAIIAFLLNSGLAIPVHADNLVQPWIRVALATGQSRITISASSRSYINLSNSTEPLGSFDGAHSYSFDISNGQVRYNGSTNSVGPGFSIVCDNPSGKLTYNSRTYRRIVRVVMWEGSLACVNVLPMEEYLWGVVPCEVPSTWPVETLRAQAVAARTYALRALERYPDRPFDVYSSVTDQVYRGAGSEIQSTTQACQDTIGEVCTFNGTPIIAYYHSTSGGWTASGEEYFGRNLSYLRPVASRDTGIHRWTYQISAANLASALRNAGFNVGTIQRVWVHRFSPEGRADEIKIVHSSGVLLISGADLRRALGPANIQSTYLSIDGQGTPDIPDGVNVIPSENIRPTIVPLDRYMLANPYLIVPIPVSTSSTSCSVINTDGVTGSSGVVVIGESGSREYASGGIWIAVPVHAGDIDIGTIDSIFSAWDFSGIYNTGREPIEDPGNRVGQPSNGVFTFVGHGCGHGVGMSQHGARLLAQSGWTYNQILRYFYTGIEIRKMW